MKKNSFAVSVCFFILFLTSCATDIIRDEELPILKEYEVRKYSLLQDVGEGKKSLKIGEKVKLYIVTSDDFIKVYCYPGTIEFLKSERTLILYLFQDDFEEKRFDADIFEEKLFKIIKPENQ